MEGGVQKQETNRLKGIQPMMNLPVLVDVQIEFPPRAFRGFGDALSRLLVRKMA